LNTEDELSTQLDKWLHVLRYLSNLNDQPKRLNSETFGQFFASAELTTFKPEERVAYQENLKYYRNIKNVVDTYKEEGIKQGVGKRKIKIAIKMNKDGESNEKIMK